MNILVTVKSDDVPAALRDYADRKVNDIEHFGQSFLKGEVVLDVQRHETFCEIVLHPRRGPNFVATVKADDGRTAVDRAVDKIERQVLKDKEKHEDVKRRHRTG